MKEHVWYVYQEINYHKSAISLFQAIIGPTNQASKDVDYIRRYQKHGFWSYPWSFIHKTLMCVL